MQPSFDDVMKWTAMRDELRPYMTRVQRDNWLGRAATAEEGCDEGEVCQGCVFHRGGVRGGCEIGARTANLRRAWRYVKARQLAVFVLESMSKASIEGSAPQP